MFITYVGGGLVVALVMLAARGGNLRAWASVSWYALTAGLLGLVIVGTIGYTVPRPRLAPAVARAFNKCRLEILRFILLAPPDGRAAEFVVIIL